MIGTNNLRPSFWGAARSIIQENIGENVVVLYSNDGDDEQVEDVLVEIDSSKRPEDYLCHFLKAAALCTG